MINLGEDLPHTYVIAVCVAEDYEQVLHGANAVEEEAMRVYAACSDLATLLAAYIRALGYAALAHHNGGSAVQAIPIFYQVGFGELGRHGSLINEKYCNVCMHNCPGDAIPKEYVMTHGLKRWLIDLEKCYPYSRRRDEYCHLCVDVCPFNVREHPDTYKTFMKERKRVGYKTPKVAPKVLEVF